MITLNASGGSITFEFSGNSTYLNDGTITVPVNSLALIIDESDFVTFKKSHSNDIFVSANIAEFGMTKAELESWFKENAVGSTGGGGITSGEVQSMIDEAVSGKVDADFDNSLGFDINDDLGVYAEGNSEDIVFNTASNKVKEYTFPSVYTNGSNNLYKVGYNSSVSLELNQSFSGTVSTTKAIGVKYLDTNDELKECWWDYSNNAFTINSDYSANNSVRLTYNSSNHKITLGWRNNSFKTIVTIMVGGDYYIASSSNPTEADCYISYIKIHTPVKKLQSVLNEKQRQLTPGDGIKLDYSGNISANIKVTGDTYTKTMNSESATTYLDFDGIKNVDMWLNQSYTGTPSGWYTIGVRNLDYSFDYYLYENDTFTLVSGSAGSTLNYDSSTGKVSITCPSGISSINNSSKFAPADDLTNADCFIGLVSYTSNEYTIQDAIDNKVNVSDNVVSAYSFDKSTKIKYPDIAALRTPSIPSGTKKISIGFTMLPSNNQLFENLLFVRPNPFGFVDVASGLTVGVAEDTSTFPFTYTVTSVTWTGDDSVMSYDISENDTLLNLYAQGDYIFNSVVPKGMNVLTMYIDVLEDIESGQTAEVVNDGIIKNFENVGKYLQDERNRVDNKIDNKLDATAYTPVVSSIMQGSTNPVEGGTLWDELRVQTSPGEGETTITFDVNNYSTNYPLGCTSLKVDCINTYDEFVSIYFYNGSNTNLGEISVANFGGIEVTNNTLPGATYEISGNIVTLSYPAQGIVKIEKMYSENFSFSAVNPPVYTSLKSVVDGKQDTLVSSVNIKTINNTSILGSGNIDIQGGGGGGTVESAITSGSTNAVESKAIWSATTYNKEVTLQWDNGFPSKLSTNYPSGCKKFVVTVPSNNTATIILYNNGSTVDGSITITTWGSVTVSIEGLDGITYTISGNDVTFVVPDTITFDNLRCDIRSITSIKAIVEGAWIADNTYMKSEVDIIQNTLQNNINQKLDSTAYTPTVVDSSLNVASTNPVENQALYSELRIGNGGETETTLVFEGGYSTNYPNGCTQIKVEVVGSDNGSNISFYNDLSSLGAIMINNWGFMSVENHFDGATYEISGTTVIISYPTVTNVTRIQVNAYSSNYTYKAVTTEAPTVLKDQVVANTTALGGLSLVKLTQAQYDALATKDNNTLYVIVG